MNVPKGYKMTEVGVIPEDWEVKRIKDIAPLQRGFDLPISTQETGEYPVVYSNGITSFHNSFTTKGPGVVTGRSGTLGKVHYVESDYWAHNTTLWVTNFLGNYPLYIYYLYSSLKLERFGSGSGVPTLNRNDVHDYYVAVPPLPEQRSIARVLSDTDELINALDKLIAKKRDIKKAVMQELLTGKTRLPGFSGEWEVNTIEQCADCLDSLRVPLNETNRSKMQGHIPYCGANGVLDYIDDFIIDDDIILLAEDGGYFDDYENRPIAYRIRGKCWVNNHVHILKAKRDFDQGFLFYSLVHKNILAYLATGTRSKLNKKEINKIEIFFPKDKAEQQAIAQILSDIDSEITALEKRRDKMKAIKQGMMQELLTGRIRLK